MNTKIIIGYNIKCAETNKRIPKDWIYMTTVVDKWDETVYTISSASFPSRVYKKIPHKSIVHYFKEPVYRKSKK